MDFNQIMLITWDILQSVAIILGGATMMFRGLLKLSEYTTTMRDDRFFQKIIKGLKWLSGNVNLIKNKVDVQIKNKK